MQEPEAALLRQLPADKPPKAELEVLHMETNETVTEETKKKTDTAGDLFDWLEIFVAALTAVFLLFLFVGRVAVVDGSSMLPTLKTGEGLLVQEAFYKPTKGDIVVCQSAVYGFKPLVKRVIAVGGDTIRIDWATWTVYINDEALEEPYVNYISGVEMRKWAYGDSLTVPDGYVFVMGDNRNGSTDSRSKLIGLIDERLVLGKVVFRYSPLSEFGKVS